MKLIDTPTNRRSAWTGSPEAYVQKLTDLQLMDADLVAGLTRGLGWEPEPEAFLRAAANELTWRRENGVAFGWVRV